MLAEWIVNLGQQQRYMFDHNIYPGQPGGRGFREQMARRGQPPAVWAQAS